MGRLLSGTAFNPAVITNCVRGFAKSRFIVQYLELPVAILAFERSTMT